MKSLTKVALTPSEIDSLVRGAFGEAVRVSSARPADEGWYNAAYHLDLVGGGPARAFLKVAPPDTIPILTYERHLLRVEIAMLEALAAAGVGQIPRVLAVDLSRRRADRDCLFMEALDGVSLSAARAELEVSDRVSLRRQIGRIAGSVGAVTAPAFGYPGHAGLQGDTWAEAFGRMVGALLDDARRFETDLPRPIDEIAAQFDAAAAWLSVAGPARLTHFDLWDGNVLVSAGPQGWRVTGVVDWERAFFGDALADLVCLTLFEDPDERAALMQGLAEGGATFSDHDPGARERLALYRAYLWLIMIVEAKPRGFRGSILLPTSAAAHRLLRDLQLAAGAEPP